jgi:hypothetical protein
METVARGGVKDVVAEHEASLEERSYGHSFSMQTFGSLKDDLRDIALRE